jgi:cytochrome c oxidase subunit 4
MTSVAEPTAGSDTQHETHEHPGTALYWKVGAALAFLTALEVSTYWWPEGAATASLLIVLMIIKFSLVAMFFMHLKFDSRVLRSLFLGGVILATGIYIATLSAFTYWDHSGVPEWVNPPRAKPKPPPPTEPPPPAAPAAAHH